MVHRINIFLLSIIIAFAPAYVMAATSSGLGGWSITNTIQQGATSILTGTKDLVLNGKNYIKTGTAKITPTASQVAKQIVKTGAVGAVALAIDLLLDGADYVMDPANNRVIYYEEPDDQYFWAQSVNQIAKRYVSANAACNDFNKDSRYKPVFSHLILFNDSASVDCYLTYTLDRYDTFKNTTYHRFVNPAYDPTAEREEKYLPYTTVGQQIIDDANSGRTDVAPPYVGGVASDLVASDAATQADVQSQLESSAQTKPADAAEAESANEATGSSKPNTANPDVTDISLEFPVFCSWAPSVCEAAQVVISFPQTLANWWDTATTSISEAWTQVKDWVTEATDYFKEQDTPEQTTEVEIDSTVPEVPTTSYFNWSAYCPFAPGSQTISLENTSAGIDYDLTSWCELASDLRPFVLAAGSLMSFLIASGVVMGRNDE